MRGRAPRIVIKHLFVVALIVGAVVGGALRFIPTSSASAGAGPGSTACAAK